MSFMQNKRSYGKTMLQQLYLEIHLCKKAGVLSKEKADNLDEMLFTNPKLAKELINSYRNERIRNRNTPSEK